MTQACRCVCRNDHSAIKIITFADSGNRKGSLYYDGLFTDGKSTVCAGSYLLWRYFCTAGSRKLLQKNDKRKRKYGADQEPVFAESKTERRRYIQDQYGHE